MKKKKKQEQVKKKTPTRHRAKESKKEREREREHPQHPSRVGHPVKDADRTNAQHNTHTHTHTKTKQNPSKKWPRNVRERTEIKKKVPPKSNKLAEQ